MLDFHKIFETSDGIIEIFDIDANDDFDQAGQKFPTMLDFNLDESNIVRNFTKSFEILHGEEVEMKKVVVFRLIPHNVGFLKSL